MTNIELLDLLTEEAKTFRKNAQENVVTNYHLYKANKSFVMNQNQIDAVLVCFINNIAARRRIDYALYSVDLTK